MKTGTSRHPKTKHLIRLLSLSKKEACGLLELLWQFSSEHSKQGDIGRWTDEEILEEIDMVGRPEAISALVLSGWLDADDTHRLLIHDWSDHCPDYIRKRLNRNSLKILSGQRRTTADNGCQSLPTQPNPTQPNPTQPNPTEGVAVAPSPTGSDASRAERKPVTPDLVEASRPVLGLTPEAALADLLDTFSADWIRRSISVAMTRNKTGLPYIRGILQDWKKKKGPDDERTTNSSGNSAGGRNTGVLAREPSDKFAGR